MRLCARTRHHQQYAHLYSNVIDGFSHLVAQNIFKLFAKGDEQTQPQTILNLHDYHAITSTI